MATPETKIKELDPKLAEQEALKDIGADYEQKFGFHDPESGYAYKAPKGLSREVVESISEYKDEPEWMREFRLKALEHFLQRPTPQWGGNLNQIDWDDIHYFVRASEKNSQNWDEVPEDIKKTFDRLGIPEAERKFLAGVGAQYESEVVYHQVREDLEKQGVIFLDMDSGLREHEDIVREYWATVIPPNDNKLAALNSAVWSGGSFVYVPKGVKVEMPLQAYFRINTENMGQFERTLIIAEEGSDVHYIEGCTAPVYSTDSLHSAVGKIIHAAPKTTSSIFSKSISKDAGRTSYRGLLEVAKGAVEAKSKVVCDALLLDEHSRSDTYPTIRIGEDDVDVGHEATVSKIGEEQVFYLQSHGIDEEEASKLIVNGFIEPIVKELPMEYAVEMNRLIELQMEGSIG